MLLGLLSSFFSSKTTPFSQSWLKSALMMIEILHVRQVYN